MVKAWRTVAGTELLLATRNVDMLLFGIAFPVGVLLVTGWTSPREDMSRHLAGIICFGICAAGLMMLPLTISDYRHRKVLKRFRVTPVSPALLLGASALTSCVYVVVSALIIGGVARAAYGVVLAGGAVRFALAFVFVQAAVFGLGALVGSVSPDARVAGALASSLYFPMILLSGVSVPFEVFPAPVRAAAQVLPMTQGVALLKDAVAGAPWSHSVVPAGVLLGVGVAAYGVAICRFRWE